VPGCHVSLVCLFVGGVGCVVVGSDSFERLNVIDPAMGSVMVKLVDVTLWQWLPLGGCCMRYFSTESLILAQDERWRRA
jgi:hypothetical protein